MGVTSVRLCILLWSFRALIYPVLSATIFVLLHYAGDCRQLINVLMNTSLLTMPSISFSDSVISSESANCLLTCVSVLLVWVDLQASIRPNPVRLTRAPVFWFACQSKSPQCECSATFSLTAYCSDLRLCCPEWLSCFGSNFRICFCIGLWLLIWF